MQALILAGGEGTRLRPLTSAVPKPVVPLVDRPFIVFMIDWLRGHGVDDVVMSCGHLADGVRAVLGDGSSLGVRLRYMEEPRAARHRRRAQVRRGPARRALPDAQRRRADRHRPDGAARARTSARARRRRSRCTRSRIRAPTGSCGWTTTAPCASSSRSPRPTRSTRTTSPPGAYVLERSVLDLLEPGAPASIERDVFPRLVGNGLYGHVAAGLLEGHRDARALPEATFDILEGTSRPRSPTRMGDAFLCVEDGVAPDGRIVPPALVEAGCRIAAGARDRRPRRARARRRRSARARRSRARS